MGWHQIFVKTMDFRYSPLDKSIFPVLFVLALLLNYSRLQRTDAEIIMGEFSTAGNVLSSHCGFTGPGLVAQFLYSFCLIIYIYIRG